MNAKLIEFFKNPASYPHPTVGVEHLETHISHIFLTGSFAYKVKKDVKLPFLDFTLLKQRKYFCERELELNSRFAPELYIEVVEISESNGAFSFGSGDRAIEYAVKMHQFSQSDLFSTLLENGELTRQHILDVTRDIAVFHGQANNTPKYWGIEHVRSVLEENFRTCAEFAPEIIDQEALNKLSELTQLELDKRKELISKRQVTHVKMLHGDLHLRNICLFNGKARVFDGIEFNDAYASCDVWADFAFLLMDLLYRERPDLAALALNCYLDYSDDYAGLPLLNLYLSYRAAVRIKVSCLETRNKQTAGAKEKSIASAKKHLGLADLTLRTKFQGIVAIGGLSGSGKTTLASLLAEKIAGIHIRSDVVRKHLVNVPLLQRASADAYTDEMGQRTYEEVLERAKDAVHSGRIVIIDAVYGSKERRDAVGRFAKQHQLPFLGIWCAVPVEEAKQRIQQRVNDVSDATIEILEQQLAHDIGQIEWEVLDTSPAPPELTRRLFELLIENGFRPVPI